MAAATQAAYGRGMTAELPTAADIAYDATWLMQACDPLAKLVRVASLNEDDYRSASFLDDRILQRGRLAHIVPLATVLNASDLVDREDVRWIFHIGHVGSTLIARMLGDLPGVLAIREPRSLRDLALLPPDRSASLWQPMRRLFSRTFPSQEVALVKATSFVSEIAPHLIGRKGKAVFLVCAPKSFVLTMLAGDNNRAELPRLAPFRAARMQSRVPDAHVSADAYPAILAAAAWACEATALEKAADELEPTQVKWADFDGFLASPHSDLQQCARFFEWEIPSNDITAVATGPLLNRYSKAPQHSYSPGLRSELLTNAEYQYAGQLASAMQWLDRSAKSSPLLRRALERATN